MSRKRKFSKAEKTLNHRAMIHARALLKLDTRVRLIDVVAAVAREVNVGIPNTKSARYALLVAFTSGPAAKEQIAAWKAARGASKGQYYARLHGGTVRPAEDVNTDAFLLSYEWRALRMRVLKRFGARCQCCGATAKDGVRIHVDHIKPRRQFPELALVESNLQVLCEACNHGKGNWDHTDWRPASLETPPTPIPANWYEPMWTKPVKPN
jgi:hypothetical protein